MISLVASKTVTDARRALGRRKQVMRSLPFQIAVHDRKENLEEQVHGIYQHRQQVEPRLARHHRFDLLKPEA